MPLNLSKEEIFRRIKKVQPLVDQADWKFWDELAKEAVEYTQQEAEELKKNGILPAHKIITGQELLEQQFSEENWLIDKFLADQGITLFVGEAGSLKSFLSLYIAKVLITKEPFLGHFQVTQSAKILLIDKENKLKRIQKRMKGLGFLPEVSKDLHIVAYPDGFIFENKEFIEYVRMYMLEHEINVVILDSFVDFFIGNENSANDTARAFNAIRSLSNSASFIVLHHDSKPMPNMQRTAAQRTRGSSNIIAQVDAQFYLEKDRTNIKQLIVEQGKSRDEEPITKFVVEIVSDDEKGITDLIYKGEFKSQVHLIDQAVDVMFELIKEHPLSSKEELFALNPETALTERTLQDSLNVLLKKKLVDFTKKPGLGNRHFYFLIEEDIN